MPLSITEKEKLVATCHKILLGNSGVYRPIVLEGTRERVYLGTIQALVAGTHDREGEICLAGEHSSGDRRELANAIARLPNYGQEPMSLSTLSVEQQYGTDDEWKQVADSLALTGWPFAFVVFRKGATALFTHTAIGAIHSWIMLYTSVLSLKDDPAF
jgi:hypothetical protein